MSARNRHHDLFIARDRHRKASAFLAWLGSHRDRLTVWSVGGKRLVLMLVWDSKPRDVVERKGLERNAIAFIANGPGVYGNQCPVCRRELPEVPDEQ